MLLDYWPPIPNLVAYCQPQSLQMEDDNCTLIPLSAENEVSVYETENIILVLGDHGYLNPNQVIWTKANGTEMRFKQSFSQQKNSYLAKLRMDSVGINDSGIYELIDRSINLTVKEIALPTPTESWNLDNSTVYFNYSDQILLNCEATGDPDPSIAWWKLAEPASQESGSYFHPGDLDYITINGSNLLIHHFHEAHIGTYLCIRENLGGKIEGWKTIEAFHVEPKTLIAVMGTFSAFGVIILLLMAALGFYFKKHKVSMEALTQAELSLFMQGDPDSINYSSTTFQDQVSLLPYDVTIEFPKENLKLGRQIGSGAFGRVLKAQAFGLEPYEKSTIVAVKTLKPDSCKQHLQALLSEIKILSHLGKHANIVNLKGAVTTNIMSGEVYVLVEYCKFGNLQKFLLNQRDKFIDQINPETGKYDSQYPTDLYRRMEQNGLGYHEKLHYVDLTFQTDPDAAKPLTRENLDIHTTNEYNGNGIWSSHDKDSEMSSLLHNKLSVKDSVESDFPDAVTDSTYIHAKDIEYCELFPTSSKSGCKNGGEDTSAQFGTVTTRHLLSWSFQIAKGMEYLASKRIVHGDLAARNILLDAKGIVKISDFGLSKNMYGNANYQKQSDSPLPIKWLALETLNYRIFSTESDVWSFGIVLWEIFSLGRSPYPGIQPDQAFTQRLEEGMRMKLPEYATQELYKVMLDCWQPDPSTRPSFPELTEKIHEEFSQGLAQSYLKLGDLGIDQTQNPDNLHQVVSVTNPEYYNASPQQEEQNSYSLVS